MPCFASEYPPLTTFGCIRSLLPHCSGRDQHSRRDLLPLTLGWPLRTADDAEVNFKSSPSRYSWDGPPQERLLLFGCKPAKRHALPPRVPGHCSALPGEEVSLERLSRPTISEVDDEADEVRCLRTGCTVAPVGIAAAESAPHPPSDFVSSSVPAVDGIVAIGAGTVPGISQLIRWINLKSSSPVIVNHCPESGQVTTPAASTFCGSRYAKQHIDNMQEIAMFRIQVAAIFTSPS